MRAVLPGLIQEAEQHAPFANERAIGEDVVEECVDVVQSEEEAAGLAGELAGFDGVVQLALNIQVD